MTYLLPGDLFLTRSRTMTGRAIRFFTRAFGESRTKVNHCGVVVEGGRTKDAVVVEALSRVRRHTLGYQYAGDDVEVAVFRMRKADRYAVVDEAVKHLGERYGRWKIALHVADWLLLGAYAFRRLGRVPNRPICSYLVWRAFSRVGINFGVPLEKCTPDDIWDYVTQHDEKFSCVRHLSRIKP